jgi:hypothetical protein
MTIVIEMHDVGRELYCQIQQPAPSLTEFLFIRMHPFQGIITFVQDQ